MFKIIKSLTTLSMFLSVSAYAALSTSTAHVVTIEKINSNGSLSSNLGLSTTATSDANGNLVFTLSNVPDNTACNFLVIDIAESTVPGVSVRKSIVPCPNAGEQLPLGVSGVSTDQASAIIAGLDAYGSDEPLFGLFSYLVLRTTQTTPAQAQYLGVDVLLPALEPNTANSFYHYLINERSLTVTQLDNFRKAVIRELANKDTGYSKLMKDAVDAASGDIDSVAALAKRGEAASTLLKVMVKAATTAGFDQAYIMEAFESMGSVAGPIIQAGIGSGQLTAAIGQSIFSTMNSGATKLIAERGLEKYTNALATLGASDSDLAIYNAASNALISSMTAAFSEFDKVFDGSEGVAQVQAAQAALDNTMENAFDTFTSATAVTNARLTSMISGIDTALGINTGLSVNEFQFRTENGSTQNWPIMMVVLTEYASRIKTAGGNMDYTRDTTPIPAMLNFMGECSLPAHNGNLVNCNAAGGNIDTTRGNMCRKDGDDNNQGSCTGSGGTWTAGRVEAVEAYMPRPYKVLFEVQDDAMILDFTRFSAVGTNSATARREAEKAHSNGITSMAGSITGTVDGTTNISAREKAAIVTLMQSPDF
jgi:hypothetical protein